jgi:hypothetical protein
MPAMSDLYRLTRTVPLLLVIAGGVALAAVQAPGIPAEPARIDISVSPESLSAGGEAEVTLRLTPKSGIRINRYPKIKLSVTGVDGLCGMAEAALGNDTPPPAGQMESNYFDIVDPLQLRLPIDGKARAGGHVVEGQLVYFYCVKKSGFCAPARLSVKIPLQIR